VLATLNFPLTTFKSMENTASYDVRYDDVCIPDINVNVEYTLGKLWPCHLKLITNGFCSNE